MNVFLQDVRYALRQLRRAPGFAVTAVLTLALGIGVTVTVMALVYRVLLAPLPYPEPGQMVAVQFEQPTEPASTSMTGSAGVFLLQHARSFSSAALYDSVHDANLLLGGDRARSIPFMSVTRGYFATLGVSPLEGRTFTALEDTPGGPHAVVVSYGFWQSLLHGDPGVVGKTIRLDGAPVTVVGVMPATFRDQGPGFDGHEHMPALWESMQLGPGPGFEYNNYGMIARLRPGVTLAQARSELGALQPQLYHADPFYSAPQPGAASRRVLRAWPYAQIVASEIRPSLVVMSWAAAAVLLLTCLNLAGLNLSRALQRAPEFALRVALGAARARLLRLAFVEIGLLALAGGLGAVLVAQGMLPFLLHNSPVDVPQLSSGLGVVSLLVAALLLGVVCAVLFGAPFAFVATWRRGELGAQGQRSGSSSRTQVRAGRLIVAGQVGLSLVLLSVATMLLGTFLKLRAQPLGFNPQEVVMFQTALKGDRFQTSQATGAFVDQVLEKLRATPGVSSAAASVGLPLVRGIYEDAWPVVDPLRDQTLQVHMVTPDLLSTLGMPLLAGRSLMQSDNAHTQPVALVSAATGRRFWPGQNAVGQMLQVDQKSNLYRVAGIVEDAPSLQLGQPPDLVVYLPVAQMADKMTAIVNNWFPMSFVIKQESQVNTAAIAQAAVASVDPTIPVTDVTTMREVVEGAVAAPRFFVQVAEGFAGFAVLLTALGIFGLLSYQVRQRTREIGVRMALGAGRGRILRSVLQASATMCAIGAIAGAAAAALLHPLVARWITLDVAGIDPSQTQYSVSGAAGIAVALLVLAFAAMVAALLPAQRAARVEPVEALRTE